MLEVCTVTTPPTFLLVFVTDIESNEVSYLFNFFTSLRQEFLRTSSMGKKHTVTNHNQTLAGLYALT